MRTTLAVVVAAVVVFLAGWWIDDQLLNNDVPRGVSVAGVDVADLAHDDAIEQLRRAGLTDQTIELAWAGTSVVRTAAQLGVVIDFETALADAEDRGATLGQPIRWVRSLIADRDFAATYEIDRATLAALFGTGDDAEFPLDFGLPRIELVDGKFAETDVAVVPTVDIEELERLILDAATSPRDAVVAIEVPTTGTATVDSGADELIARAEALTDHGLRVRVLGSAATNYVPPEVVETWLTFGGTSQNPTIGLDDDVVLKSLGLEEWGFEEGGAEATFAVDSQGAVRIVGPAGIRCCGPDTSARLLDALLADDRAVDLLPLDPGGERGVVWAQSLGITELVGEFTTDYKPGQSRVTNIRRIAELTRGAIIEPDGMFSINEYVGRRTTDNGFVPAGMIANGTFRSSVGGGISQYATTLFNAAFFAGLDFGQYQSHSIYISRYPYGREATVSFPLPNLEILNTTPYSVLIWPTTTDDSITVRLYSTQWAVGEQTGQAERREGVSCTRVTTERTRTFVADDHTEVDTVTARYRPEGRACDGTSTRSTTTTTPPTTTPATTQPPNTQPPTTAPPSTVPTTTVPTTTTVPVPTSSTTMPATSSTTTTTTTLP